MAVVNVKSTYITNADNKALSNPAISGDVVEESMGVAAAASGDSIGSTYRLTRVRSGDRVSQVLLSTTAITTCAGDVGLYRTAADGGAVVDADLFGSAVSLASALSNSDVTTESGVITVANLEKRVWELLGLTADPFLEYDLAITLTAAAGSDGTVAVKYRYIR